MLGVRLFPPQVLSDLNFFNVKSEKKLALRLRTLQRVAAAAIGTYLMVRYKPILAAKLGSSYIAREVANLPFYLGYGCLSFPTVNLIVLGDFGYLSMLDAVSNIRNKEVGWAVANVAFAGMAYFVSQGYRDSDLDIGPNLLEKLFQKVEDKLTQPLWDRFYKKQV